MTFLNPFVLFGLAAASIPILIHLFNIRKLRTIEFSTLSFLKELNKNKIRKIKIRQWLLLALRTLLILLIVLAFSRPALKGSIGISGTRAASTIVILIDNSASMSLHNERGRFLAQAQARAQQIVSMLQPDDEVYLLRLTDLPKPTTEQPIRDKSILEGLIVGTEIGYSYRTVTDGLRTIAGLLQQSKNFNKEVYILTDGQQNSFSQLSRREPVKETLFEPNVRFFVSHLSGRRSENVSVERVTLPPSLVHSGKTFTVNAVIKNNGSSPVQNHLATIIFDGERVMQKSVSLNGGESATVEFLVTPKRSGALFGTVELESDVFESDDRYLFSINVPERIDVAVVPGSDRYARYILAAVDAAAAVNSSSPISAAVIPPSRIVSASLAEKDVVVITGVENLPPSQAEALQNYIRNGGSLLFFPSADTSAYSYNYMKNMAITDFSIDRTSGSFDRVDLQFPLFNGMFDERVNGKKRPGTVESPSVTRSLRLRSESSVRSIISLSGGRSFLWSARYGRGTIIGLSVPATSDWSDLPLKGIFVPLVYQSLLYLSSPANTEQEQTFFVGDAVEFTATQLRKSNTILSSALRVNDPEGRSVPLRSFTKSVGDGVSETLFLFGEQRLPGIYSATIGRDTLLRVPINVRREESDGTLIETEAAAELLSYLGVERTSIIEITADSDIAETVTQSRFGIELWRYFLFAAVLIALIEMFIAREPRQQQHSPLISL